jgi:hypothetical protein
MPKVLRVGFVLLLFWPNFTCTATAFDRETVDAVEIQE